MKVADLYTLAPQTLGVASLMLTDGRSLVEALNSYKGITIPVGQRCSIQAMVAAIDAANLSDVDRAAVDDLLIDETSIKEGNQVDLTPLDTVTTHGFSQNFTIVIATVVMAVITLAYTFYWGWLAYTEHVKPSIYAMAIVIAPWLLVVWKSQGIISRERRDVLSVLVGDAKDNPGLWSKLESFAGAMKK